MLFIWIFIGILVGGTFFDFEGALCGAMIGWLGAAIFTLRSRMTLLELAVRDLRLARPHLETPPEAALLAASATAAPEEPVEDFIFDLEAADEIITPEPTPPPRPTIGHPVRPKPATVTTVPAETGAWLDDLPEPLHRLITGGNLLVKLGVVILFFGVSFLVKYAAQRGLLPVQLRLTGAALGGIALLATGWQLHDQRQEYALALQGGGIGILAITIFAAYRICHLLPPATAFGLLALVAALCAGLALLQDARTLALFGLAGGFLAPLLTGIGSGNPSLLFGYYAMLNLSIATIAWFRSWRELNLAGFIATFVASLYWGGSYFQPAHFATVEPFLIFFFLLYVGIATLFALRQPTELRGAIDGTLVFGTPIAAFVLQAALVTNTEYGLAWSALTAGLVYLSISTWLRRQDEVLEPLTDAYLAFGALFVTLSVPLACDGRWTAAIWAMEGAGVAWAALRQGRSATSLFGIALQLAAGSAFICDFAHPSGLLPVANALYLGTLLLCLAGLTTARVLQQHSLSAFAWSAQLADIMTAWGLLWWLGGGLYEIDRFLAPELHDCALLLFITTSCWLWHFIGRRLQWRSLGMPALLLTPTLAITVLVTEPVHPLANNCWLAWPLALASCWLLLQQREEDLPAAAQSWLHGGALWLTTGLATWELSWQVQQHLHNQGSWQLIALVTPALAGLGLITALHRSDCWPLRQHRVDYLGLATLPLAVGSWLWLMLASAWSGDAWPFPWLPLLNPLDLVVLATLLGLWQWWEKGHSLSELALPFAAVDAPLRLIAGATLFHWVNTLLARTLHHWSDVPYTMSALFHSFLIQTCFAIFWTLLALVAMFTAGQRASRQLWSIGASLLGLVVLKLFTVDLAGHGSVERIISFVAVGLLLLVIGWLAPVPPGTDTIEPHRQDKVPL